MPRLRVRDAGWRAAYLEQLERDFGPDPEGAFLRYLRDTQGSPERRLAGTVFEPWLKDAVV
jgi:hypothetical protein